MSHATHPFGPRDSAAATLPESSLDSELRPAPDGIASPADETDAVYRPIVDEMARRPRRVSRLEVLRTEAPDGLRPLPGTITVFYARPGTGGLDLVRAAVEGGPGAVERLREELKRQHADRRPAPLERAVRMVTEADVFADIHYGGQVLSRAVFLPPEVDLAFHQFPYNGGRLAKEGFALVERYVEGTGASLEAIVLRSDPPLTDAERAALDQLPPEQLAENVGREVKCGDHWTRVAVAVAVVVIAVVATILLACLSLAPERSIHLTEEELEKLGPTASARKLLALRERFIAENMPRPFEA